VVFCSNIWGDHLVVLDGKKHHRVILRVLKKHHSFGWQKTLISSSETEPLPNSLGMMAMSSKVKAIGSFQSTADTAHGPSWAHWAGNSARGHWQP